MYGTIIGLCVLVTLVLYPGTLGYLLVFGPIVVFTAFFLEAKINESDKTTRKLCAKAKKEPPYTGDSKASDYAKFMRNVALLGFICPVITLCAFVYGWWLNFHTSHDIAVINDEISPELKFPEAAKTCRPTVEVAYRY